MAFIGDDINIGATDQYIGSWYSYAYSIDSEYLGIREEDLWVFYDDQDRVITELDFESIGPALTIGKNIKVKYRGFNPIKVYGFYLKDLPRPFYNGTNFLDKETLIEWADLYTGSAEPPGVPGMEIQFVDFSTEEIVIKQIKSGVGDTEHSLVNYTGHRNGIIRTDDKIELRLRITAPTNQELQILKRNKFHFGLEIAFMELPYNLSQQLIGEGC